jgi:hypothetical protein
MVSNTFYLMSKTNSTTSNLKTESAKSGRFSSEGQFPSMKSEINTKKTAIGLFDSMKQGLAIVDRP